MRLSAEQFAELSQSFGTGKVVEHHENRRAARVALSMRVTISHIDEANSPKIGASICDFSARGLAVLLDRPLASGAQFITHLPRKTGGVTNMLCTVAHSRAISKTLFRIGAEFTCTLPETTSKPTAADDEQAKRIAASMLG